MIHYVLHVGATGLTALAVCVHPGLRRRASALELATALIMLAAMADVVWFGLIPAVCWMAGLLASGIALAALRSSRRRLSTAAQRGVCETTHAPLGLIAAAACLPFAHAISAAPASGAASAHSGHGEGLATLTFAVVALGAAYLATSIVAAVRTTATMDRLQYVLMGAGAAVMAAAAAV